MPEGSQLPGGKYPPRGVDDGGGDGPLSEAMRLAGKLRRQGMGEAAAATHAAHVHGVAVADVVRGLGFRGAAVTLERRARKGAG